MYRDHGTEEPKRSGSVAESVQPAESDVVWSWRIPGLTIHIGLRATPGLTTTSLKSAEGMAEKPAKPWRNRVPEWYRLYAHSVMFPRCLSQPGGLPVLSEPRSVPCDLDLTRADDLVDFLQAATRDFTLAICIRETVSHRHSEFGCRCCTLGFMLVIPGAL